MGRSQPGLDLNCLNQSLSSCQDSARTTFETITSWLENINKSNKNEDKCLDYIAPTIIEQIKLNNLQCRNSYSRWKIASISKRINDLVPYSVCITYITDAILHYFTQEKKTLFPGRSHLISQLKIECVLL